MKLRTCLPAAVPGAFSRSARRREEAMAVMVVIALLAIILIFVAGTARALHYLGRDVKRIEQQQIQRINCRQAKTNALPAETRGMKSRPVGTASRVPATPSGTGPN